MHFDPSISAALLAPNHDSQVASYSRQIYPPTSAVMFKGLKRRFKSRTTQVREIQDGVDLVRRKLEEQHNREMADLRASEYFAPPMYCDSALTLA
jgi:hypothetical protein